jgi:hypothetical protein
MQSAATIADASRRLEEASAIFRYKSRAAAEEYDELSGRWSDARARQFSLRHLQPQGEYMQQGARMCGLTSELANTARSTAETAEHELSGFYALEGECESSIGSARRSAQSACDLAERSVSASSRAATEIQTIQGGISAAAQDPGW